ncbi:hypothetical protein GGR57DRAFT_498213 [Xylariaceae sp. FL1272]|nr:hypothetical protein GGR57DRAFT_498213 [Xylariaceae sp. FL1272]
MASWNSISDEQGNLLPPITSKADVQQYITLEMLARNVTPPLQPTDLPTQADKERDAMAILTAMIDQRFARSSEDTQAGSALYDEEKARFPLKALRIVAWILLEGVINAALGICTWLPWQDAEFPAHQQFAGYRPRLDWVINALRLKKDLVQSCFENASFPAKLSWNPGGHTGGAFLN